MAAEGIRVRFVDDIPRVRRGPEEEYWDSIVDELKTQPGRWAEIVAGPRNIEPAFSGQIRCLKRRGCETTTRKLPTCTMLYGRWPVVVRPGYQ